MSLNTPGYLLFNPGSGSTRKYTSDQFLAELPPGTLFHGSAEGEDPAEIAKNAIAYGVPWIAAAGGDGTVEAVAGALVGTTVHLGVIPCGTYNNFARNTNIPSDPLEAAKRIRAGVTRQIDVGFVNDRPFFECVGIGLDAAIFPFGEQIKTGGFIKWLDLLRAAAKYERQVFEIGLDRPFREAHTKVAKPARSSKNLRRWFKEPPTNRLRLKALMVTISNGPYYGANFAVAPDARIDDGHLTVTVFKKFSKPELWWHFFSISSGRRVYAPQVVTLKAREVEISGPRKLEVHKDGAALDAWPLRLKLETKSLSMFC